MKWNTSHFISGKESLVMSSECQRKIASGWILLNRMWTHCEKALHSSPPGGVNGIPKLNPKMQMAMISITHAEQKTSQFNLLEINTDHEHIITHEMGTLTIEMKAHTHTQNWIKMIKNGKWQKWWCKKSKINGRLNGNEYAKIQFRVRIWCHVYVLDSRKLECGGKNIYTWNRMRNIYTRNEMK